MYLYSFCQVRVVAYDSCNPVQKTVTFVRVTVIRNENRPVFEKDEYAMTIEETQPLGVQILQVKAEDTDPVSLLHTFLNLRHPS